MFFGKCPSNRNALSWWVQVITRKGFSGHNRKSKSIDLGRNLLILHVTLNVAPNNIRKRHRNIGVKFLKIPKWCKEKAPCVIEAPRSQLLSCILSINPRFYGAKRGCNVGWESGRLIGNPYADGAIYLPERGFDLRNNKSNSIYLECELPILIVSLRVALRNIRKRPTILGYGANSRKFPKLFNGGSSCTIYALRSQWVCFILPINPRFFAARNFSSMSLGEVPS